jgi:hypothetical protein
MIKTLIAGIAAATLLGSVVYVLAAGTEVAAAISLPGKVDSFDARWPGKVCKEQTWPYYDSSCLHDPNRPGNRARTVRVLYVDRTLAVKAAPSAAQ